jgi:transcriptional regulator with XRE-family HTH domain
VKKNKVLPMRLKIARERIGFTQEQVSEKLNISIGTVSGYERNHRSPNPEMLERLADLYNVSTDYLLGRSDDPKLRQIADSDMLKELEEARKAMDEAADRYLKILEKHSSKKEISPD